MDYSERKLTDTAVWALGREEYKDGTQVSGTVRLQLSNMDGEDYGPSATLELAATSTNDPTIKEAERTLLIATHGIIQRLAALTPDEYLRVLEEKQPKNNTAP